MSEPTTDAPGLVIDGAAVAGEAPAYPIRNPVRPAEIVVEAPAASPEQLDAAVAAARRAQPAWAALGVAERARALGQAATAAAADNEAAGLARLLTREHGKVLWESMFDVGTTAGMVGAFATMASAAAAARPLDGRRTTVEMAPHGVVAVVLPFNWPVAILGNKAVPALLVGNTVVVKAPPTCPAAVLVAGWGLASRLPPGVLNIVNGPDVALGEALVGHPGVDMVTFTGGVAAGRAVAGRAAAALKPVVLELGGNDPAVLAPDIVVDDALADGLVGATFVTSGQVCMAIKRLYVHRPQLPAVVDALVERLSREVVGDGLSVDVTMGPVHRAAAMERVEALVDEAERQGAKVHRPATVRAEDRAAGGYLVSPALVEAPPPDAGIVVEEQFAPALPVLAYDDLDDAVAAANRTSFGLCASIWTGDSGLAADVARRLEAGTVFVNQHGMSAMDHRAPFGGWKESGQGLEMGPEGMGAFLRPRVVLEAGT